MFEAAAAALPVITIGWGGQTDFLYMPEKRKGAKKKAMAAKFAEVEYSIGNINPEAVWEGVLRADASWAFPNQGSYKMKLREVLKKYRVYQNRATDLQGYIKSNFTEEKMYGKFVESMGDVLDLTGEEFNVEQWLSGLNVETHE